MSDADIENWRARKAAACASGTDQLLSTNYSTVANEVNLHSNPARRCMPLTYRRNAAWHINVFGYPFDLPYARTLPNPTVTTPRAEGYILTAWAYRLSCDFNKDYFTPVFSVVVNQTVLNSMASQPPPTPPTADGPPPLAPPPPPLSM